NFLYAVSNIAHLGFPGGWLDEFAKGSPKGTKLAWYNSKVIPCGGCFAKVRKECQENPQYLEKTVLNHRHAAIDVNRLTGDIGGFVRRQIYHRRGDLVGRAHAGGGNFAVDRG